MKQSYVRSTTILLFGVLLLFFSTSIMPISKGEAKRNLLHAYMEASAMLSEEEMRVIVCPGKIVIKQSDLPYTITAPGLYIIGEDLIWSGGGSAAITVAFNSGTATNVVIDFCDHSLTLNNNSDVGISLLSGGTNQHQSANIRNGRIISNGSTGIIHIEGDIGIIENMEFLSKGTDISNIGILLSQSPVLPIIKNCSFSGVDIGIRRSGDVTPPPDTTANNISIDNCLFNGTRVGISLVDASDVIIRGCEFLSTPSFGINLSSNNLARNMIIVDCLFNNSPINGETQNNVQIKNCTLNDSKIAFVDTQNLEIVDTMISGLTGEGGIQLGAGGAPLASVRILNCSVTNGQDGIDINNATDVIIANCFITNFSRHGILWAGTSNQLQILNTTINAVVGSLSAINISNTQPLSLIQSCRIIAADSVNGIETGGKNPNAFNNTVIGGLGTIPYGPDIPPLLIAPDDTATQTANYWYNVAR